jgi:hypothetical protein
MLYIEIIAVCSQIHKKHINTLCGKIIEFFTVKPGGTYSNHSGLKCHTSTHIRAWKLYYKHTNSRISPVGTANRLLARRSRVRLPAALWYFSPLESFRPDVKPTQPLIRCEDGSSKFLRNDGGIPIH